MSDPYVREVGSVEDIDGVDILVGVDYDSVTIGMRRFSRTQTEELAQLFAAACWEAGLNARQMAEEEL